MSVIVFVCGSNRARSPMAAAYFAKLLKDRNVTDVEVCSAGLKAPHGETICWEARETLHREGLEPLAVGATQLLPKLVRTASLIVCMTEDQKTQAEAMFPSARGKTRTLMSVIDSHRPIAEPEKGNLQKHIDCLNMMRAALEKLADVLA